MDTHLHRQLVTLLSGPVVESFDREFRILFAASLPVPEVRAAPRTVVGDLSTHYRLSESSDLWYPKHPLLEPLHSPPPPPPVESPLDWEALGVFQRRSSYHLPDSPTGRPPEEVVPTVERPTQNAVPLERQPPIVDDFSQNVTKRLDKRYQKTQVLKVCLIDSFKWSNLIGLYRLSIRYISISFFVQTQMTDQLELRGGGVLLGCLLSTHTKSEAVKTRLRLTFDWNVLRNP